MTLGIVKWFNQTKGYAENGSKDVFVHVSELEAAGINNLYENDRIEFEIVKQISKSFKLLFTLTKKNI